MKQGKRTWYRAESPEKLRELYEEEMMTFETIISQMEKDFQVKGEKPILRYYEGKNELKKMFIDVGHSVPEDGIWYRYSSRIAARSPDRDDSALSRTAR